MNRAGRASPQPLLPANAPQPARGYDLFPHHDIGAGVIGVGLAGLADTLARLAAAGPKERIVIEGSAAVDWSGLVTDVAATPAGAALQWFDARDAWRPESDVDALLTPHLTDDVLFGHRYPGTLADLLEPGATQRVRAAWRAASAPAVLAGPGAATVAGDLTGCLVVYVDVPKNEAQYRQRAGGATNLGRATPLEPKAAYKRSYFVDWMLEHEELGRLWPRLDLFVDAQRPREPAFAEGARLRSALDRLLRGPVRARPWFEPGAWGGQWLQGFIPELPRERNYAWSFELIAPENGLVLESDGRLLEVPFELLLLHDARAVLGDHAGRFGTRFPIRFDYLDTIDGGNLSLQCHPSPAYIESHFGERITQDETYYIARATDDARVYLGFRDGATEAGFRPAAEAALRDGTALDVEAFVQTHPARRHDLFLIPHGTIHCSGRGALVLEISATPYIFTFKIYDWQRLDLDGQPRTINLERAFENLDFGRRGETVTRTLLSRPRVVESGPVHRLVHLPTHPDHFYDVQRLDLDGPAEQTVHGGVHVLNVVEGAGVEVASAAGIQRTYREAETFVLPAAAGSYTIAPLGAHAKVVKAYLKDA